MTSSREAGPQLSAWAGPGSSTPRRRRVALMPPGSDPPTTPPRLAHLIGDLPVEMLGGLCSDA